MEKFFQWLYDSGVGTAIRESASLFPWIESVHVLSITLVVGSIAVVDLRLLGVASKGRAISRIRVHQVEGSDALGRLRFDQVRVSGWTIDGAADLAMECVEFRAERWQAE